MDVRSVAHCGLKSDIMGGRKVPSPDKCAPALQLSLDGPRRNDPRYPGAQEAMNAWFVVMNAWFVIMIILLGIGALTLHRYDVWRVLIWIAFGWFVLGALLLGYRCEHLSRYIASISGA